MAVPVAGIAAKLAIQAGVGAARKINRNFPGGIWGLVAILLILAILLGMSLVSVVMTFAASTIPKGGNYLNACEPATSNSYYYPITYDDGFISSKNPYNASGHPGVDFEGKIGNSVMSVSNGKVEQVSPSSISIVTPVTETRDDKTVTVNYYFIYKSIGDVQVKQGDEVKGSDFIGRIANEKEANQDRPHLHLEIRTDSINGTPQNPQEWLESNNAVRTSESLQNEDSIDACAMSTGFTGTGVTKPGAWGGYANGQIPNSALCALPWAAGHYLRCDAEQAFEQLNNAFRANFNKNISLTDSYRPYSVQVSLKESWCSRGKCQMAATPGTSNHGWGMAVDLASNINVWTSKEHIWMKANAPGYGWINPDWAQPGKGKEEPWHWEFWGVESGVSTGGTGLAAAGTDAAAAQNMAKNMMGTYGWNETQFQCLVQMWTKESGWNYKAANPTSSARGIPQMMMSVHYGNNWQSPSNTGAQTYLNNPATQIKVGLDYIKGRYATPCGAWSKWQTQKWY